MPDTGNVLKDVDHVRLERPDLGHVYTEVYSQLSFGRSSGAERLHWVPLVLLICVRGYAR